MHHQLDRYRDYFGLAQATFTRIAHDEAMISDVYEVLSSTGQRLIQK